LIASEFWFFPIFKKFSRLKNATIFGIVIFFLVASQRFEEKIKKSKKGS
jgi:hypothetical protein